MEESGKFGATATQGLASGSVHELPAGRPTPATLEDIECCFDSLAGAVVIKGATLAEIVNSNATLTVTNAPSLRPSSISPRD